MTGSVHDDRRRGIFHDSRILRIDTGDAVFMAEVIRHHVAHPEHRAGSARTVAGDLIVRRGRTRGMRPAWLLPPRLSARHAVRVTIARFKDLCMDATDPHTQARFWQQALRAPLVELPDGDARLDPAPGRPPSEVIWVNRVPEPRVGSTRVHLNIRLDEPDPRPLMEAGADLIQEPGEHPWWVLADPEGNEFWAFPPLTTEPGPGPAFELVTHCGNATALAEWWAAIVGGAVTRDETTTSIAGAHGFPWQRWIFKPVTEPKTVKNRLHWDVQLTGPTPDALVDAGATMLRERGEDISWWVLADPEGNEFCAFAPR